MLLAEELYTKDFSACIFPTIIDIHEFEAYVPIGKTPAQTSTSLITAEKCFAKQLELKNMFHEKILCGRDEVPLDGAGLFVKKENEFHFTGVAIKSTIDNKTIYTDFSKYDTWIRQWPEILLVEKSKGK